MKINSLNCYLNGFICGLLESEILVGAFFKKFKCAMTSLSSMILNNGGQKNDNFANNVASVACIGLTTFGSMNALIRKTTAYGVHDII